MRSTSSPPSCPPRWATPRTDRRTYGPEVALIAEKLGQPLMPWQRQVVDTALEIDDETGQLAYREIVLTVPRQSGKTTLLMSLCIWRALKWGDQRIHYTAQSGKAAREKWQDDQLPILDRSPFGDMYDLRISNGREAVCWRNGSYHYIISPTDTAGHGTQCDLAVVDEAFHLKDQRLEQGLKPAMVTRSQPQMWIVSTAGTAESYYLKTKVERGRDSIRDGATSGLAFFDWSAAPEDDPADPSTWWKCIPALGYTVREDTIAGEQMSMEPAEFDRAFLNRWTAHALSQKIPGRSWDAAQTSKGPTLDDICFGVDIAPDRASSSIAVCDGTTFELADRRPGNDWVIGRCIDLWDRYSPKAFVMDGVGPAAGIVPELEAAGVRVVVTSSGEYATACGRFYDAIVNRQARHTGDPDITAAVTGAATRKLGDRWAWSRSSSALDISPLVAATLALYGATTLEHDAGATAAPVFAY